MFEARLCKEYTTVHRGCNSSYTTQLKVHAARGSSGNGGSSSGGGGGGGAGHSCSSGDLGICCVPRGGGSVMLAAPDAAIVWLGRALPRTHSVSLHLHHPYLMYPGGKHGQRELSQRAEVSAECVVRNDDYGGPPYTVLRHHYRRPLGARGMCI